MAHGMVVAAPVYGQYQIVTSFMCAWVCDRIIQQPGFDPARATDNSSVHCITHLRQDGSLRPLAVLIGSRRAVLLGMKMRCQAGRPHESHCSRCYVREC